MRYFVRVEPDEDAPGKSKICIRRVNGESLVGTPARKLSAAEAEWIRDIVRFAFNYGLQEAAQVLKRHLADNPMRVERL